MRASCPRSIYKLNAQQLKPKVISIDEENDQFIALTEKLAHQPNRTTEESALYDLLITLIKKYEDEQYPMGESKPLSMLLHLMEAKDLKEADLVRVMGSSEVVSEIIRGEREISKAEAKVLGDFFQVDPELFI